MDNELLIKRLKELEDIELLNGDNTREDVYMHLMIFYLLTNQPQKAKFVWKRIPTSLVKENVELNKLWKIIQNLINRKYSIAFDLVKTTTFTNQEIQEYIYKLIELTKQDLFILISNAYTSISIQELSNIFCMSIDECIKIGKSLNWSLDGDYLKPCKQNLTNKQSNVQSTDEQMQQLTSLVSFLET